MTLAGMRGMAGSADRASDPASFPKRVAEHLGDFLGGLLSERRHLFRTQLLGDVHRAGDDMRWVKDMVAVSPRQRERSWRIASARGIDGDMEM